MKDDTSTPTGSGPDRSPNEFERDLPQTAARNSAEADIERLRRKGGVFVNAVRATRMPMALTDPNLPGNPIVFANEAFLKLSGYGMEEVLGQQPHFMNGPMTDPKDAARFAEALRSDQDDIIETLQYRKDGSPFVATVLLSAFKDDDGRTLNHFMSWLDVTRRVDAEEELADQRAAHSALREELRNINILHDLGARLVPADDIQTIYEEILTAAIEITGAIAGTLQVLDDDTGRLVVLATRGFSAEAQSHFSCVDAGSDTSCGVALRSGNRAYFDFDPSSTDPESRLHVGDGVLSAQSSPLVSRTGKAIGMVSTHWGDAGHRLSERESRFMDLLARQAADLIERRANEQSLRESEAHARMLLGELQHRVRNTLAVVRSIARRTAERSETVEDMMSHLEGRLNAFSRVQSAVTRNAGGAVDLKAMIEDELLAVATREGQHLEITGPDVFLKGRPAESISLAIHELATNAVKYGALCARHGRVGVSWRRDDRAGGPGLRLDWVEKGLGRKPDAEREGFGHEVLRRTLPYELGADTDLQFTDDGLHFTMTVPLGPEVTVEEP